MNKLMGHQLKEMAEISSVRKNKVILLSSLLSIIAFTLYGYHHLTNNNLIFGFLCLASLFATTTNLIYLLIAKNAKYTDVILTVVLVTQACMVFVYGAELENRLLWVYPILATVIFINTFCVGLIISCAYCLLAGIAIYGHLVTISSDILAAQRFYFSLIAICAVCNTSSYFYSKAIDYITSLYLEGIEKLAYRDHLTGLANRWSFENWATAKLSETPQDGKITALVFLDIDNFKHINDSYGHEMGDKILKNFAHRIKNNVRTRDRKTNQHDYAIARFAGDEFVLLLYDVNSLKDLDNILYRICHLFDSKYKDKQLLSNVTISVGAALYPQDADNLPELTRCADKAMYAAKHNGKNQYCYYQNVSDYQTQLLNYPDGKVTPIHRATELNT
ncbi:GGDEF domain-containing protein [Vibrio sp. Y2-5]|uniref:GGDEF domain-containing protein n=1 Tax=Vibrio TaxID=662 RepID=UPI00142E85F9|nr:MULTISPECIES: GGDEF domain-containing protein [Vibrio]MBD0786226.1 GGDEF domain-containing protein [Vibrio sp. Y2-5]NIY90774.1 GGDEF domain-containing protein [Vibrio diazotrophicus]